MSLIEDLQLRGVVVHAPAATVIEDVDPLRFEAGAEIFPGCTIRGARTLVGRGTLLGKAGGGYFENASVDVSGSDFDNLSSITFQFRFFDNATDNSNQINRLDDIQLSGTIVPEPASLALLPLGALALGRRRR